MFSCEYCEIFKNILYNSYILYTFYTIHTIHSHNNLYIHTINFLKTTKRFERPLLFLGVGGSLIPLYDHFLISLLHSHLFCKHDVVTLLAPYQLLQISIFSLFLNNASQVFVGSKHTFVQHITISVLSEVSAG